MTVKIKKHLNLFRVFSSQAFEYREDSDYFRKILLFLLDLLKAPISIVVKASDSCSSISQNNSIDIHHWNNNPHNWFRKSL